MATGQKKVETPKVSKTQEFEARKKQAAIKVKNVTVEKAKGITEHVGGFSNFIRSQGVIGLAIGLAIGTAAGDTVKKLVEGFINPIVQFLTGSGDKLATASWHVELFGRTADFAWGAALSSAITLLATALVIYWLVHVFKLDKLDKKKQ